MAYRLTYAKRAVSDIAALDVVVKKRLGKTLLRYAENPLAYARKLTDPKLGAYRFRIGDHRVIFDLIDEEIIVLRVGHRRDIHK